MPGVAARPGALRAHGARAAVGAPARARGIPRRLRTKGVRAWSRLRQGKSQPAVLPAAIGVFYCAEGICGARYLGNFFLLFVVQAVLLWVTAWLMRQPRLTPGA